MGAIPSLRGRRPKAVARDVDHAIRTGRKTPGRSVRALFTRSPYDTPCDICARNVSAVAFKRVPRARREAYKRRTEVGQTN